MTERLCRHEICRCRLAPGETYCDPSCAHHEAQGDRCLCGHPECRPQNAELYDPSGPGPLAPRDLTKE